MKDWNKQYFSSLYAEIYQKWLIPKERTQLEVEAIKMITGMNRKHLVLDVAAGYGRHAATLAKVTNVIAMDFSKDFMTITKKAGQGRIKCAVGDMRALSFKSNTFDYLLLLFSSFGYFETTETKDENFEMLKEFSRVLKKDGEMILEVPNAIAVREAVMESPHSIMTNGVYDVEEEFELNASSTVLENNTIFRKGSRTEEVSYRLHLYEVVSVKKELKKCGFKILDVYGDYEGSPFKKNVSDIALFHCMKN